MGDVVVVPLVEVSRAPGKVLWAVKGGVYVRRRAAPKGRKYPFRVHISMQRKSSSKRSSLPSHHETCKVSDMKLLLHVNRHVDAEANKREQEPSRHKREPQP